MVREAWEVEIALALSDNDLALISQCPTEPVDPVREANKTDAAFVNRQCDHAKVRLKYDLDRAKWDSSNRKCLMVIVDTGPTGYPIVQGEDLV